MTECREQGERSSGSSDGERRRGAHEEEAREHKRERGGAHRVEATMAREVVLSTAKWGGRGAGEQRMPSTRNRRPDTVGRARRGRVRARAGEGGGRGAAGLGWLRWLGRLVGAGPPVNSPPFLFFEFLFSNYFLNSFGAI